MLFIYFDDRVDAQITRVLILNRQSFSTLSSFHLSILASLSFGRSTMHSTFLIDNNLINHISFTLPTLPIQSITTTMTATKMMIMTNTRSRNSNQTKYTQNQFISSHILSLSRSSLHFIFLVRRPS